MKNSESININDQTNSAVHQRNNVESRRWPESEYYGPRQRKKHRDSSGSDRSQVACERIKTNIIYFLIILVVVLIGTLCYALVLLFEEQGDVLEPSIDDEKYDPELPIEQRIWYDNALTELRDSMHYEPNENRARNVILFVGDGMGLSTLTASRIYKYGEEGRLTWETFPHFGLLKVSKLFQFWIQLIEISRVFPHTFFLFVSLACVFPFQ